MLAATPRRRLANAAMLGLVSGLTAPVLAIGLGEPRTAPRFGQPLALEIPLVMAPGEALPRSECVRLQASGQTTDPQFFPRSARVAVQSGSRPLVRIVSSEAVTEPMLEFRLAIGCETVVARDFLLLAGAAAGPASEPRAREGRADISVEASATQGRRGHAMPAPHVRSLVLPSATSLNAMARAHFPASREMRDDYRRRVAESNPQLFAGIKHVGTVPLPAGTTLLLPADLPAEASPLSTPVASPATRSSGLLRVAAIMDAPAASAVSPGTVPRQDRLILGAAGAPDLPPIKRLAPRELSEAIDRIARMVEDQGRTEVQLVDGIDTVNKAFVEMKDFVTVLDSEQRALHRAQKALERKVDALPEPRSLGAFELFFLIMAAGGVGAALIMFNHWLQQRRSKAMPTREPEEETVPILTRAFVPKPSLDFV